ncbi:hypothetical protein CEP54_014507 [Fusarium duplospermum]|uniref:Uncharacterized protein n=1 Tax=Fusarium duplospermum TaxID=1325734 RepID=A0A428NVL7_9HYPO|nr:hypothetical protein CEP54_014507 [Fusarium duplospermum]
MTTRPGTGPVHTKVDILTSPVITTKRRPSPTFPTEVDRPLGGQPPVRNLPQSLPRKPQLTLLIRVALMEESTRGGLQGAYLEIKGVGIGPESRTNAILPLVD